MTLWWPFRLRLDSLFLRSAAMSTRIDAVVVILAAMAALYGLALSLQPDALFRKGSGLQPCSRALLQLGMTGDFAWRLGWWWTTITAIYLHGGLAHIAWNSLYIYAIGKVVTDVYGHARMFILFNISGAFGFLLSNSVSGAPTVGGTGAMHGLLGGLLVYGHRHGGLAKTPGLWWTSVVAVVFFAISAFVDLRETAERLAPGLSPPRVNGWLNLGGLVSGSVVALFFDPKKNSRESTPALVVALCLVVVVVVGVGLSYLLVTQELLS